jgi:hypothetical protein
VRLLRYGDQTVKDSSSRGNDGIMMGDTVRGVPGHQGTAYAFDDLGSWVEIPSDPSLNPEGRDFVISAWVSFPHAPQSHDTFDIIRKGLSFTPSGMYKLELVSNGRARCTAKDATRRKARITSPQTGLADGGWHQVGCARVGATWSVVVDGVATVKNVALGAIANDMELSIGSKYGREDVPHGAADDVVLAVGRPASVPVRSEQVVERIRQMEASRPVGHWLLDEAR